MREGSESESRYAVGGAMEIGRVRQNLAKLAARPTATVVSAKAKRTVAGRMKGADDEQPASTLLDGLSARRA